MTRATRVLVVDNRDSFVFTLVGYLRELGAEVDLVESDAHDGSAFDTMLDGYDGVLISPGPGRPEDAGASMDVVRVAAEKRMPLLGVCLGHQSIAAAFGAAVTGTPELKHGMVSDVLHETSVLFRGIPSPFRAGRYHSLAVADVDLPDDLVVTARTREDTVMAIAHGELPIWGVQFHPESVLTESGYRLLANWLEQCGSVTAVAASAALDPLR